VKETVERLVIKENRFDSLKVVEIIVSSQKGKFRLNNLLPQGWIFVEGNKPIHTDPERKRIQIPQTQKDKKTNKEVPFLSVPGNTIGLLHEAGHAFIDEEMSMDDIELDLYLRQKMNYQSLSSFTQVELKEYVRLVLKAEKKAWDFALSTYSNLLKMGFNIEPDLNKNDLKSLAARKMKSYPIP